jgi:Sel1 repeat
MGTLSTSSRKVVITSTVVIVAAAIIWHFVVVGVNAWRLAKDVAASRTRAQQGDAKSQLRLGWMYAQGKGVPHDDTEAVRWYRKSAEQRNAKAEYSLSRMYREGRGVSQDYVAAVGWCRKAAEQGDAIAEDGLGFFYYQGEGVKQNYVEAARWYSKSAEQGFANAQYDLGYMYYNGYGVEQDRIEALRLFREAAAQGDKRAQEYLGWNQLHPLLVDKLTLSLKGLCGLLLLVHFFLKWPSRGMRTQRIAAVTGLLCLASVGLDLYFYIGQLQSEPTATTLYFARHLISGVLIALLLSIISPKKAKVVLKPSIGLLIVFIVFRVVRSQLRHIPLTFALFDFGGLFVGMAIPSAILLWLDRQRTREERNDTGALSTAAR